ncbi:MAG: type II toxin-antitoxin system HicA family toxin [Acidobacteria bacterium]|nr:type II toxin-antitoxin system HicA family toxin [Acidobacteriota bacterium]
MRDVIRLIEKDGWHLVVTEGSHRQFKHASKPGRVTVAGHPGDDVHPKTLKSILTQAGLKK